MSYQILRCPYCGVEGDFDKRDGYLFCKHCGLKFTDDAAEKMYKKLSENMRAEMEGVLNDTLFAEREKSYYNLRSLLWDKINAKYTDSGAIVDIARDIRKIDPHDFLACFFEVANCGTCAEVCDFINSIDAEENYIYIDLVLDFLLNSLKADYVMPISYLIERAYKGNDLEKYEAYVTRLEEEAERVNNGIYETMMPRDVFVAYSSRDIESVMRLVSLLEENGFSCFAAMRNLQHGRGAVANYEKALAEAMDNSKIIVFVSSKNSRIYSCDAIKKELPYIKRQDIASAPAEYKNNYERLPLKYKKPRIEYRLDDVPTPAADAFLKEFFAGLDYCETTDKVLMRVVEYISCDPGIAEKEGGNSSSGSSSSTEGAKSTFGVNEAISDVKDKISGYFASFKEKIAESQKAAEQKSKTESKSGNTSERRVSVNKSSSKREKLENDRKTYLILGILLLIPLWPLGAYFLYKAYKANEELKNQ